MKTCPLCKKAKPKNAFNKNKARPDGLQVRCRECQKAQHKKYYQTNKESFSTRRQRNRKIKRQFLFNYLKDKACADCGEEDWIVLEFDHQRDKEFNLSSAYDFSLDRIKQEIDKCEVVCRNCHIRRTAKQFDWYSDLE